MAMQHDPGDYYRQKDQTKRLLIEVLERLTELQMLEPHCREYYQGIINYLEKRLEMARYTGD